MRACCFCMHAVTEYSHMQLFNWSLKSFSDFIDVSAQKTACLLLFTAIRLCFGS